MKLFLYTLITLTLSSPIFAKTFKIPQGKGKCPAFTFEGEKNWSLKSDRPKGDRWWILDGDKKTKIVRIDFNLSNTDQKQLPEVESKDLEIGGFTVEKYTVTLAASEEGQKATSGLITSYSYTSGKLDGLVFMSDEYDAASGIDKKIEKILATVKLK